MTAAIARLPRRSRWAAIIASFSLLATVPTYSTHAAPIDETDEVRIATVQFELDESVYRSQESYFEAMESLVAKAVFEHRADIVVFPEYINVFLIASRFPGLLDEASDLRTAIEHIEKAIRSEVDVPRVVATEATAVVEAVRSYWSSLARRYQVAIIPGTVFAPVVVGNEVELRNRLYVIDSEGAVIYRQDKVYLTSFESEILELSPGEVSKAEPIEIAGLTMGVTICRDTFFDAWHNEFADPDVWIDLRANGTEWTPEVYESFQEALPERVTESGAAAGVNASLTGKFLGLEFGGPSFVVDEEGRRVAASEEPVGTEITVAVLEMEAGEWELVEAGAKDLLP